MNTFVIADIHGRADLLKIALAEIKMISSSGSVIFLGDYVDRGNESKQVIDILMAGPKPGWNWKTLRGNHEDMLLECHNTSDGEKYHWWRGHGGSDTMRSYGGDIPQHHIEWMDALPRIHWDEHRVYVHAGVSESSSLSDQTENMMQWYRYPPRANVGWNGKHVVHGHTPHGPEQYSNRTNLDGNACNKGILLVGVFDDAIPGGPTQILRITT